MDVSTHEGIHLVTARDDGIAVFLRQCWQDKAVRHVDAELISAAPSARMALEARVDALRRIPANRVSSDPSARHAHLDEAAIVVPDGVDPRTKRGDRRIGPVGKRVERALAKLSDVLIC